MSHVKAAIYDDWACLGSANWDRWSFYLNKELNIATSDPAAVQAFMDEVLAPDFDKSVELKQPLPEKWSDVLMEMLADHL
jgi:phosphatidylserine/phosphatidylglycerophosphate/cardiolipin synthase-like enzyme